jgi:hypothetical protein
MTATQAVATVLGGLLPSVYGTNTYSTIQPAGAFKRTFRQSLGGRGGYANVADRSIMRTLQSDGAVGTLATNNRFAIAPAEELGGQRQIVSYPFVNRVTTAADQAEYRNEWFRMMSQRTWRATALPNLDRNPLGTR